MRYTTGYWRGKTKQRWPAALRRKHCIDWAVLTDELEDIWERWVREQGLQHWVDLSFPYQRFDREGNRRVTPEGHGPDADEVNEDEYY